MHLSRIYTTLCISSFAWLFNFLSWLYHMNWKWRWIIFSTLWSKVCIVHMPILLSGMGKMDFQHANIDHELIGFAETYWISTGLEIKWHKQVTHTQRYVNNAWSQMVSSHPCLALYSSWSPWLIQTIWDNSSPTTDQPCRLITTLLLLVLHFYDYEQPNAPPPTKPTMRRDRHSRYYYSLSLRECR